MSHEYCRYSCRSRDDGDRVWLLSLWETWQVVAWHLTGEGIWHKIDVTHSRRVFADDSRSLASRGTPRPRLAARGARHAHPQDVTAAVFRDSAFFDPQDVVQVKYEMLRHVRTEPTSVAAAAAAFGFSRPVFYWLARPSRAKACPGYSHANAARNGRTSSPTTSWRSWRRSPPRGAGSRAIGLAEVLVTRFGIVAHPRSIERSLARYAARRGKKR